MSPSEDRKQRRRVEEAIRELNEMNLGALDGMGLGRDLDRYYLFGNYPPVKAMKPVNSNTHLSSYIQSPSVRPLEFYYHVPFCTSHNGMFSCNFCHFYKEAYSGDLEDSFLDTTFKEIKMYEEWLGKLEVESIYFGGGTPSILSPRSLDRLFDFLSAHLLIQPGAEIKFEIHPVSYGNESELEEKLKILKRFGVTNIVMDIQTFNAKSLESISRGAADRDAFMKAVRLCREAGFNYFTTALMIGLPFETLDSWEATLETILGLGLSTINAFPLMLKDCDPIWQEYHEHPPNFPDVEMRDRMTLMARRALRESGYVEQPIYFFNKEYVPSHQLKKFLGASLLGIGPSAFGFLDGFATFNVPSLKDYIQTMDMHEHAVWRGLLLGNEERARRELLFALNALFPMDIASLEKRWTFHFEPSLVNCLKGLEEVGLLQVFDNRAEFTEKGKLRAEEISFHLSSPMIQESLLTLEGLSARNPENGWLERFNYFPRLSEMQAQQFRSRFCGEN